MKTIYDFTDKYRFGYPIMNGDNLEKMIEYAKAEFEAHKGPYMVCVCNKQGVVVFYLEK